MLITQFLTTMNQQSPPSQIIKTTKQNPFFTDPTSPQFPQTCKFPFQLPLTTVLSPIPPPQPFQICHRNHPAVLPLIITAPPSLIQPVHLPRILSPPTAQTASSEPSHAVSFLFTAMVLPLPPQEAATPTNPEPIHHHAAVEDPRTAVHAAAHREAQPHQFTATP
jgi:hypothetical protein